MKKTLNVVAVILISCALVAWGLTTTTGVHLINSVIDSTSIGNTTPSTGRFTSLTANSAIFGSVLAANNAPTSPQGAFLGWNVTGGGGETDFVNSRGSGGGGWSFFNVSTGGAIGSPVARIDGSGNVFAPSFNGNLNGTATYATSAGSAGMANNANTANSANSANVLNSPVYNCGSTTPATGIQTNGNANCGSSNRIASNGFSTLPGGLIMQWGNSGVFNTGPVTVGLATTFPHACLQAVVGDASGTSRIQSVVSCSQSTITIRNDGSGEATYYVIGY